VRIPSPNIWHWPEVYAQENAAQDVEGAVWAALRDAAPWTGRDVVDIGCGDGYHLRFFDGARSVLEQFSKPNAAPAPKPAQPAIPGQPAAPVQPAAPAPTAPVQPAPAK